MIKRIRIANTFLILISLLCLQSAAAQPSKTQHLTHFRVVSAGLLSGRTEKSPDQRQVQLYTAGGFINILPDSTFIQSVSRYYFRLYNTKNKADSSVKIFGGKSIQVYLNIDQEYVITLYDQQTDSMITRCRIKRIQVIPELMLYRKLDGDTFSTRITARPDKPFEIQVKPGERITFRTAGADEFDSTEIDYVLTDLKKKKTLYIVNSSGFGPIHLEDNTPYQLSFRYALQRETTVICYITVQPYWYQSPYLYISFSVLMAAAIFIAILTIYKKQLRSSKAAQDKLEDAAVKLQSLLNPHFTFNALSTIQGLMNTGRIDEANLYLQEFSSLLRKALSKSQQVLNTLDQELDMMRLYIGLEALRFNFSWQIEVADPLHPADIEIPTLLLQPLIENAIKHGIAGMGDKGQLRIICKAGDKKDSLVIVISDNGTWKETTSATGYGLQLTEARIQTANKLFHRTQLISLTFNKQSGTAAVLTFHNWINQ